LMFPVLFVSHDEARVPHGASRQQFDAGDGERDAISGSSHLTWGNGCRARQIVVPSGDLKERENEIHESWLGALFLSEIRRPVRWQGRDGEIQAAQGPRFVLGASTLDDEVHVQIPRAALDKRLDTRLHRGARGWQILFQIAMLFFSCWVLPLLAIRVSTREREGGHDDRSSSGTPHIGASRLSSESSSSSSSSELGWVGGADRGHVLWLANGRRGRDGVQQQGGPQFHR
jgi:hypothetical protein